MITSTELSPWNDPDELLDALLKLPREPLPSLVGRIAQLLQHSDPDIREEALRVIAIRWKVKEGRTHALEMLSADPAPGVRGAAAYALAALADLSTVAEDTKRLLGSLLDTTEQPNVRGAAYDALLIVQRKPNFPTKRRDFDPEADVDWPWINVLVGQN
jgi:HEAT repeat protein